MTLGRRAVELAGGGTHVWFRAASCGSLAATLLALGDRAAAADLAAEGLTHTRQAGAEAYLLRCLAPLAQATGARELARECHQRLIQIRAPAGSAWLLGVDAYLSLGRAWLDLGEPDLAASAVAPLAGAARRTGWGWVEQAARAIITPSTVDSFGRWRRVGRSDSPGTARVPPL